MRTSSGRVQSCLFVGMVLVLLNLPTLNGRLFSSSISLYGTDSTNDPDEDSGDNDNKIATCAGCYCIPDKENNNTCPTEAQPPTEYPNDVIDKFKQLRWANPLTLSCDPYTDDNCNTNEYSVGPLNSTKKSCCVVEFATPCRKVLWNSYYTTRTFQGSIQQARAKGLYVTHDGPCGLCSSMLDLAVYIEKGTSLRKLSQQCGFAGVISKTLGVLCFQLIAGLSKGCSEIWYYNTKNTRASCPQCIFFTLAGIKPNLEPPKCMLNDCIQCDETKSGPIFKQFAGRTRRNTGIVTDIVRNCSEIRNLNHRDPCKNNT